MSIIIQIDISITAKPSKEWSQDETDRLRELWAQGLKGSEIGKELGRSRNSVIGRANRMGLEPRSAGWTAHNKDRLLGKARKQRKPATAAEPVEDGMEASMTEIGEVIEIVPAAPAEPVAGTRLVDLRTGQCRWVINDPPRGGDYRFCDDNAITGSRYCDCHTRRSLARFYMPQSQVPDSKAA